MTATACLTVDGAWRLLRSFAEASPVAPPVHVDPAGRRLAVDAAGAVPETAMVTIAAVDPPSLAGPVEPAARTLLEVLLPLTAPDWCVGQLGQSLDGRIATVTGHAHYINGPENIDHLHRLRALADVVLVGAGTVAADDPQLTVRRVEGRSPARAVIDGRGTVSPDARVFADDGAPRLVLCPAGAVAGARLPAGVQRVACGDGSPAAVLAALRHRGFRRIFVEGGGRTVSRFLQAGCLDRLHVCVAPLIIGSGIPGLDLAEIATLDEALRPPTRTVAMGADTLFDLDLRGALPGQTDDHGSARTS